MKRILALLTVGLSFLPLVSSGAQTAQGRFVCLSLRVQRGTAVDFIGIRWTLDVSTLNVGINNELQPGFVSGGYSNGAYVELEEEFGGSFSGIIGMSTPNFMDVNTNGFDDFFEVSQGVPSLTGQGRYIIPNFGNGTTTVTWTREAGAAVGSCLYVLPDPFVPGEDLIFYHLFELIEFVGPLTYTP